MRTTLLTLATACCLGACSDSPAPEAPTPAASNEVPASASVDSRAYTSYVASLPLRDKDKPLDVSNLVPPTSETALPEAVQ